MGEECVILDNMRESIFNEKPEIMMRNVSLEKEIRERLGSYYHGAPFLLPARITPLKLPQIIVEPGFFGSGFFSFLAHLFLFLLLVFYHSDSQEGSKEGDNAPQVEMVFEPPSHSQQHTSSPTQQQDAGAPPPPPPPSQKEESAQKAVIPTPETPEAEKMLSSDEGELALTNPSPKPLISAKQRAKTHKKTISHMQSRAQTRDNNPFAHPMTLSFNAPPAPPSSSSHRGRRRGRGGPIDMSLGPLSLNGQINAPYHTRTMVKGVSSDYGAELDNWIRAHMFYPEDAANNGEEGPSSVHVVIDRSGRVKSVRLTGQSGSYSLDAATSGMFQGAKLPPVPPDMSGDHFDIDVTINYILIRH